MKILYWIGWFLGWVPAKFIFRWRVTGEENVPREGGFITATNHISYFDPNLIGTSTTREMAFFAKAELFEVPILGWIIRRTNAMPVRRGAVDRNALKMANKAIKKGYGLVVFPEGTRSKTGDFLPARPGLGLIAAHAECPVVPAYVHGANKLKDVFRGRDKLRIIYGEPFSAEWVKSFGKTKEGYQQISEQVMARIRELRDNSGLVAG